ncbi:unnamed protein product [Rotaria sp. Silwood2]|nr:unnamed protein product [Rotaria sp. Silwood2]
MHRKLNVSICYNNCKRSLVRQHKVKFHKRSKEIQEDLKFDIKILESIGDVNNKNCFEQSVKEETIKENAFKMLKEFKQKMILEKDKEKEVDGMFPEEIAKQWYSWEQEWNRDKELRDKLIHQILNQRQKQIIEKLEKLKEQQQYIYERQRTLINDMQQARKYDIIEKQKQIKEREEIKQDSSRQISFLQQKQRQSQLELEKQDTFESEEKKSIHDFIEKVQTPITTTTVEPKFYGRRRVNWN